METTGNKNPVNPPAPGGSPEDTQTDNPASARLIGRPANKELWIVLGIYLRALCLRLIYLYESSTYPTFEALSWQKNFRQASRHWGGGYGVVLWAADFLRV